MQQLMSKMTGSQKVAGLNPAAATFVFEPLFAHFLTDRDVCPVMRINT